MIFCDAHVHFYDCFELDQFLDSAWNNFLSQSQKQGLQGKPLGSLMLTEGKQDHWYRRIKEGKDTSEKWSFRETSEPDSLYAERQDGGRILIVNGRQIITAENLEVLALATSDLLEDGKPIDEVVEWVKDHDAIPVIPWGFGKWWGSRGHILSRTMDRFSKDELLLGDNSGRTRILGHPSHFARAINEERRILPGSDPLPFATEAWRPGSVGFFFDGNLDESSPARMLRDYLRNPVTRITSYMQCEGLLTFVKNQLAMQIKKRV